MLYKRAWEELKDYIERGMTLLDEQERIRQVLLTYMKQLEKRWKIIPEKAGRVKRRIEI